MKSSKVVSPIVSKRTTIQQVSKGVDCSFTDEEWLEDDSEDQEL